MAAHAALDGNSTPVKIGTGFTVLDKANVDDPAAARFIYSN